MKFLIALGHTSDRNMETIMLKGSAIKEDSKVTARDPTMSGNMPNSGGE